MIEVVRPGLLATVQDLGRPGYGHLGVPHSGAADAASLRLANRLAIVDHGRVVAEGEPEQLKQELKGDVIQVELPAGADRRRVSDALGTVPAVRDILVAGRNVSARSDDGAAAVPAVLSALALAGSPATSVTVARPSLDEVYLRYTGRRYSQAQEEQTTSTPTRRTDLQEVSG